MLSSEDAHAYLARLTTNIRRLHASCHNFAVFVLVFVILRNIITFNAHSLGG